MSVADKQPVITYTNKRGKTVSLKVSDHAAARFVERYTHAYGHKPMGDIQDLLQRQLDRANLIKNFCVHLRARRRRYGTDTLYYRNETFTMVIKNGELVTVELAAKNQRHMNRPSQRPPDRRVGAWLDNLLNTVEG